MDAKEIVFVLGMHRSGTSLVAELVHAMGYRIPGTMLAKDERINARGFWESKQVVDLDERLLAGLGASWFQVGLDVRADRLRAAAGPALAAEIRSFVERSLAASGRLVIKDPRLCQLLPSWLDAIDRSQTSVKAIWVTRHPQEVAASLRTRDGFSDVTGHLLWLDAFCSGLKAVGKLPCLLLDYDRVLADHDSRAKLAGFLGRPISSRKWSTIVTPQLAHHRAGESSTDPVAQLAGACHGLVEHGAQAGPAFMRAVSGARLRYERLRKRSGALIAGLADANAALVASRRQAMQVGALHSKALEAIAQGRLQLAEFGAVRALADERQRQLAAAAQRIADLEADGVRAGAELERLASVADAAAGRAADVEARLDAARADGERAAALERSLGERDADLARNASHIEACHRRITQLESAMVEFRALRARLAEVEASLADREGDIARNTAYIDACHRRIAELDAAAIAHEGLRVDFAGATSALAEREAEIARQAADLAACRERIAALDAQIAEVDARRARLDESESALARREADAARDAADVESCRRRIAELQDAATEVVALRARLSEVESALAGREADVAANAEYIGACHRRIEELHASMAEFKALRARLAEVESTLAERDADVARNTGYIETCHRRIAELDAALVEFQALRKRLAEVESASAASEGGAAGGAT